MNNGKYSQASMERKKDESFPCMAKWARRMKRENMATLTSELLSPLRNYNDQVWFSLVWFGFMAHQLLLVILYQIHFYKYQNSSISNNSV